MARTTSRQINTEVDLLARALCQISDSRQMIQFLSEIMTPAELHDLSLRWELMGRLSQGQPQRQIAAKMKISLCKITRGAKILKNKDSVCRKLICNSEDQ